MTVEIKTNYVEPLKKEDVIALFDGSISLKRANELKPIYTQRIDYILDCIFKSFNSTLNWYYTKDFTSTIEDGTKIQDLRIHYINKEFGEREGISFVADKGPYSTSFPASWLYESFESNLSRQTQTHKEEVKELAIQ